MIIMGPRLIFGTEAHRTIPHTGNAFVHCDNWIQLKLLFTRIPNSINYCFVGGPGVEGEFQLLHLQQQTQPEMFGAGKGVASIHIYICDSEHIQSSVGLPYPQMQPYCEVLDAFESFPNAIRQVFLSSFHFCKHKPHVWFILKCYLKVGKCCVCEFRKSKQKLLLSTFDFLY